MGARLSRVVSTVVAGTTVAVALALGGPAADAAPTRTVDAGCGSTVTVAPGDRVRLNGVLLDPVTTGTTSLRNLLCTVQVKVVGPVASKATEAAPALEPVTGAVAGGSGALDPSKSGASGGSGAGSAPSTASSTATPAPGSSSTVAAGPAPAASAGTLAAASAFAPMFRALPSSFLASAAPIALPIGSAGAYDAGLLLTGPPGLRIGAPSFLGLDPASAVTSSSQLQALPVDGLGGGIGVPAVLAALVISAAAALGARRAVLGRRLLPGRPEEKGTAEA